MIQLPTSIGKFELEEKLGSGYFGTVYKGRNTNLDSARAVKLIPLSDSMELNGLLEEARNLHACEQQHTVRVFDAVQLNHEVGDFLAIEMELLPEGSLLDRATSEGLSFQEILIGVRHTLLALSSAHKIGIIHRDVKPANILISGASYKLGDFGISFLKSKSEYTTDEIYVRHAPPEVLDGSSADEISDIYAVGMTLFRLCRPSSDIKLNAHTFKEWRNSHRVKTLPEYIGVPRYIPTRLKSVIKKATAINRADRYQSAREMLAAVNRLRIEIPRRLHLSGDEWSARLGANEFTAYIEETAKGYICHYKKNGRTVTGWRPEPKSLSAAESTLGSLISSTMLR